MGKVKGFTPDQKTEIVRQAKSFLHKSAERMAPFYEVVNELERLTRVLLPQALEDAFAAFPDRSALVPPTIYNNMRSIKANIRSFLFKRSPYFRLSVVGKPNLRNEGITKAEQILQMINDQAGNGVGFPAEVDKVVSQACYAGRTCTFLQYTRNWERVPKRDSQKQLILNEDGRPDFEYKLISEYPETKSIDIRRCRPDPSANEPKDCRIVGVQSLRQFSELQALNRNPKSHYDFDEKELYETSFDRSKYFEYQKSEAEMYPEKAGENHDFADKQIENWSIRGLFVFKDKKGNVEYRDLVVELGNKDILLALKENDLPIPGWELFSWPSVTHEADRFFPMGLVEPARDGFIETFLKRNQSLDSGGRNVYATYIGDASACAELPEYIESANDQLIKVDLASAGLTSVEQAIGVLRRPPLAQESFMHSQVLERETQQTMGLSDYLQGKNPESSETATGVAQLVSGGKNLTDHVIEVLADTFFKKDARQKLILWNFFNADKDGVVYDAHGKAYDIEPGELDLPYHVAIDTRISATNPGMVRRTIEAFPILKDDPWIDQQEIRRSFVSVLELPNSERLVPPQDYLETVMYRENAALGYGIELDPHPLDNQSLHIEKHVEYLEWIQGLPPEEVAEQQLQTEVLEAHIEQHQMLAAQSNDALGNTKDLGGNAGNLVQPEAGAIKQRHNQGTGRYTPSEGRQ